MINYQATLIQFLDNQNKNHFDENLFSQQVISVIQNFDNETLADLYVDSTFLNTFLMFLKEQHWIHSQKNGQKPFLFLDFVGPFLKIELSLIPYVHSFLKKSQIADLKQLIHKTEIIEKTIIPHLKTRQPQSQKKFLKKSLIRISNIFEFENSLQILKKNNSEIMGLSMYRTFDSLDQIFELNYYADIGMKVKLKNNERLYEGAGVGVQSGYSTILVAIQQLNILPNTRFIDLGSGYGRMGLILGLVRPDIQFIGYEYVEHRVDISRAAAEKFEIQDQVQFLTQDLSDKEFNIPNAEIYYMYDPFTEDTYRHVLSQLISISHKQKISIATKGNARSWLLEISQKQGWPKHKEFDDSNLCLFSSC